MRLRRVLAVMPVVGVLGAAPLVNPGLGADELAVYPSAGTQTASPTSQISFRGATQPLVATVTGSSSGNHTGHFEDHSDGNGTSFIPDSPFKEGETVTVKVVGHTLVGADQDGAVRFKIYTSVPGLKLIPNPDRGGTPKKSQHFRSEPKLLPPSIKVQYKKPGRAPGDLFTAPKISRGQDGAMITNGKGQLIWFHRAPKGTSIYDFREQQLDGQPVLTWWQGKVLFAKGYGEGVIWDNTYKKIAKVKGANGYKPDLHEFQLGPNGTAYTTSFQPVMYDVSGAPGRPKSGLSAVFDCVVQQIDIKTGLVEFEWHAIGHIPFSDSYSPSFPSASAPYDPYHVNSIDPESSGKLLISARNTSAVYELDPSTGNILWTLGGKSSSFTMGAGATFVAQHDVRRRADGDISIFDNGSGVPGAESARPARGIVLHLDTGTDTATLVHKLKRRSKTNAPSQGNVETLPNNNFFVGWGGSSPYMSEFDPNGNLIFDARFDPKDNNSYRSYKFAWSARPYFPPKLALQKVKDNKVKVYATWNGATDVRQWEVLAGSDPNSLSPVKTVYYNAYETSTKIPNKYTYVAVRAHAADGSVLGTSLPVKK